MSTPQSKLTAYLEELLLRYKRFTGRLELNFKDGELKDIWEGRRTTYPEKKKVNMTKFEERK